jgi:hypothetical protein
MARDTMTWLITLLREKVNDTDESIWTDNQLQNYLDMHRLYVRREFLIRDVDGTIYLSKHGMLEDDVVLLDSCSANATEIPSSNYTANLVDGAFSFTEEQDNAYYLDAKSYNIHGAIAECMEQLAMDPNKAQAWERGGVKYTHYDYMEMAKYHRNFAELRSKTVVKTYRANR